MAIGEFSAVLASFNALKNIAQSMLALHDVQALQLKALEFNGALLDTQSQIFAVNDARTALIERVRDLEQQIADLEAWEAEKQCYELTAAGNGTFAYAVKPAVQGGEPPHQICATCYQRGKKSILQPEIRTGRANVLACHECGAAIYLSGMRGAT
jgi:hypothetical protein